MTEAAARWLAAYGLAPARPVPCRIELLVEAARVHRLTGVLARAVAEGAVPVTVEQRRLIGDLAAAGARRSVGIEAALAATMERLSTRGLTPVVLKGAAVAHLDHRDPADREFLDVDLLVRAEEVPAVLAALGEHGYTRNLPERRPGFDARFGKDITVQRGSDLEFDLHVRPAFGAFGQRVPPELLFEFVEPFSLAGVPMSALDAPGRLVHACYNAVLADPRPKPQSLRDVAVMVTSGRVPVEELRARARRWGGEAVVAAAVARAWREFDLPVDTAVPAWATSFRPRRSDRLLLRTYPSQGGTFAACLLGGTAGVPGLRAKAAYVAGFARPSREYREERRRLARVNEYREGARQVFAAVTRRQHG